MPRWARFLSCSFTGLLLSLLGFLLAAHWWEGGASFWAGLLDFVAAPAFWYLVSLFALLSGVGLILARVIVHLYELPDPVAGLMAGALVATIYVAFLLAAHAADWGGLAPGIHKVWPAGAVFAVPFGLSGAFTTWLWDRLD
ncbi:MAG TPA: hypothetical protein VGK74_25820 [Symbiobacteriaceae bacterium]|jgi:hypothetical protein